MKMPDMKKLPMLLKFATRVMTEALFFASKSSATSAIEDGSSPPTPNWERTRPIKRIGRLFAKVMAITPMEYEIIVVMKTVFRPILSARYPMERFPTSTNTGPVERIRVLVITDTPERKGKDSESGPIVAIMPQRKKLEVLERIRDFWLLEYIREPLHVLSG
jgi:hypothetical protein